MLWGLFRTALVVIVGALVIWTIGPDAIRTFLASWKEAAPAAGALTAIGSATVALLVFNYTRAVNRRRATLDMVMKTLMDADVQEKYQKFKALVRNHQDPQNCFKLQSLATLQAIGTPDRRTMLHQLNIYELMALGIRRGVFDESFYKRWYHNQFMTDYEGSKDFIDELQKNKSSIYCECSYLYRKWERMGHPEFSINPIKMAWWGLTSNTTKIDQARAASKARSH